MRRIVTISYTGLDAGGGVPAFNRALHSAFPDRSCDHFCWTDVPDGPSFLPEWEKALVLNRYLVGSKQITRDDVVVADGFWANGLERFPFAISHSHGIWGHVTAEDVASGKQPENLTLHNQQIAFRRRWREMNKSIAAVSDFIASEMQIQWGFVVDRVIDNGVDGSVWRPLPSWGGPRERPIIVHGINDRGNVNKGWDHIGLLERELNADVCSLDELSARLGDDKPTSLATADLFVHPSGFEGNSMMVAEALSCGLPIVGYNVGYLWKLWRDAGEALAPVGEILNRNDRSPQTTLDACRRVLGRLERETTYDHSGLHHMGTCSRMIADRYLSIEKFRSSWRDYVQAVEDRIDGL